MRLLTPSVALLLLAGTVFAQLPFTGLLTGTVVTGTTPPTPLEGVTWSVEGGGILRSGKTDASGGLRIDLPTLWPGWSAEAEHNLAVSFTKPGYEQVIWIPDCQAAGQSACLDLQIKLTPLPGHRNEADNSMLNPDEIDTLDRYYSSTGLTLFLLSYTMPAGVEEDMTSVVLTAFQDTITDHLQTLPVRPPPQDITPPPDVSLESLEEIQAALTETEKTQLYGRYLNALAMINGVAHVQRDASSNPMARLRFDYSMIPFHSAFEPIREVVSYTVPATELSFHELYEKVSERWGFYTLLALCIREINAFDQDQAAGDRARLERVYAYLVAERSQLRRHELFKRQHLDKLFALLDQRLGKRPSPPLLRK